MSEIQKPGTIQKENKSAVSQDSADESNEFDTPLAPKKVDPKKPLDKVQKRAKGIKLTPIEVVSTQDGGWYGNRRIKLGDKFKLDDETDFSHNWMKKI